MNRNTRARALRGGILGAILAAGAMWWSMTTDSTIFLPMLGADGEPVAMGTARLGSPAP